VVISEPEEIYFGGIDPVSTITALIQHRPLSLASWQRGRELNPIVVTYYFIIFYRLVKCQRVRIVTEIFSLWAPLWAPLYYLNCSLPTGRQALLWGGLTK